MTPDSLAPAYRATRAWGTLGEANATICISYAWTYLTEDFGHQ